MAEFKKMWPMWSLIAAIIVYLAYQHFVNREKTGYIIIQDAYNQFEMKKEMQKKFEISHGARKRIIDSTAMVVRMLGQKIDGEKGKDTADINLFRRKRSEYFEHKRQIDQDDSAQLKQCDEEILTQLNQYIKDFGKENHYQYIFGNGNGSLLAADESANVTAEVSKYVNERYEGKK
ncbi:MAG TPA: OmpH family outer membrane protein [Bacteroidia bacterium]|jgi:outer membrane protein|nr:OmpH family outer membrane protein [Bacteroidia bacterium]